jgi:DNA primase
MRDIVSEIKSRLSIEDVASQYVSLKKTGRYYKGLSPFTTEKTPSFVVSPEKQLAYCFSTHKGGDMFRFVQDIEGVEFPEAVKILAEKAGIQYTTSEFASKASKEKTSLKRTLIEIHEKAVEYYIGKLRGGSIEGKKVLEYLYKRGMTDELIDEFGVGYAPDSYDGLLKFLGKEGFKRDVMIKSGLMTVKDTAGKEVIDKFRGRLMIPIYDHMGRPIGFGGRALGKDQQPKYLNSPDTPIYLKRNVLYGLSHAKQALREKKQVLFVEGYFDVIMLHKVGIKNVVASSGTALSSEQVQLIKRHASSVITCFDTDKAGIDATQRAFTVMQEFDMTVKTLAMPLDLKDPADFVLEKGDTAAGEFLKLMEGAGDFVDYYSFLMAERHDLSSPDGKKSFLNEMIPLIKMVKSTVNVDYYVRILARRLQTKESFVYDEIKRHKGLSSPVKKDVSGEAEAGTNKNNKMNNPDVLLGIFLENPVHFGQIQDKMDSTDFSEISCDIFSEMKSQFDKEKTVKEGWNFDGKKNEDFLKKIEMLSLYAEGDYGELAEETVEGEVVKLIDNIQKQRRMHQRLELEKAMKEADESGDKKKQKELLEKFQKLLTS